MAPQNGIARQVLACALAAADVEWQRGDDFSEAEWIRLTAIWWDVHRGNGQLDVWSRSVGDLAEADPAFREELTQVLHGCATTTHAVRTAIQRSKAPLKELAARYGLNHKTVAKWRKRAFRTFLPDRRRGET